MQLDSGDALTAQQQLSDMNLVYRKLVCLSIKSSCGGCMMETVECCAALLVKKCCLSTKAVRYLG
jgi:hypothetical protein